MKKNQFEVSELGQARSVHITVDERQSQNIFTNAESTVTEIGDLTTDAAAESFEKKSSMIWDANLPAGARLEIKDFIDNPNCSVVMIDKISIPKEFDMPPTPIDGRNLDAELQGRVFDALLISLVTLAGFETVANSSENAGRLVRNVLPVVGMEDKTSSHGSRAPLGYHNDQPNYSLDRSRPFASLPDALAFICLKNPDGIATEIICIEDILDKLSFKTVRLLCSPAYKLQGPASTKVTPHSPVKKHVPILLQRSLDDFIIRYDPNVVEVSAKDKCYQDALDELRTVLETAEPSARVALEPGQMLLFKNRKVLHMRKGFSTDGDPESARWLKRIYCVNNRNVKHEEIVKRN